MRKNNRSFIKFIITGVLLLIGIAVVFLYGAGSNVNKEGSVTITNFDSYVKNLSPSERGSIESTLYNTVASNTSDVKQVRNIKDAAIRKGSYGQTYRGNVYTTVFIVDIKSIKQSYTVQDKYSRLGVEQSGLTDYTTLVLCPDEKDLLYGDFKCQDLWSQQAGVSQSDPILQYLPVSTLTYSLDIDLNSKDLHIIATIHLSSIDYKLGKEQSVNQYKLDIQKWFESKGLDVQKYSISYEY